MNLRLTFLAVVVLAVAACGGSDDDTDTASDAPTSSGAPTTVAPDEPLGAGPYPVATLDITISHPDADEITYTISCLGDTATVIGDVQISDIAACTALADDAVRSRLVDGAPVDQVCTEIFGGSDVADIVGTYDDAPVDTMVDRADGCGIADWDELLADVLPPALGITNGT